MKKTEPSNHILETAVTRFKEFCLLTLKRQNKNDWRRSNGLSIVWFLVREEEDMEQRRDWWACWFLEQIV